MSRLAPRLGGLFTVLGCLVHSAVSISSSIPALPPPPDVDAVPPPDDRAFPGARVAAAAAIEAMNTRWYNGTDGRWSTPDAWWVTGNALQGVLDYTALTGDETFMSYAYRTYEQQVVPIPWWPQGGGNFRADSTDDTAWWALAMVRMYDVTKDDKYLDVAKTDEEYIYSYWNNTCGGGVIWDIRTRSYKNAISNELYMTLAAALHNRIANDTHYLEKAETAWSWFQHAGLVNHDDLINDGLADHKCRNNNGTTWTYNQGVVLGAAVELYKATSNASYLTKAREVADAVLTSANLTVGGVLTEPCEEHRKCDGNQQMFKGIFTRNLMALSRALGSADRTYRAYVDFSARNAWKYARGGGNASEYTVVWAGPYRQSTIAMQASAVSLMVSLIE